jgi:hypothetical protein
MKQREEEKEVAEDQNYMELSRGIIILSIFFSISMLPSFWLFSLFLYYTLSFYVFISHFFSETQRIESLLN